MDEHLLDIARKAVKKAEALGAQQAEAYVASSRSFSIEVENGSIKSASERRDAGCGIRSVIDKKVGFAYVTTLIEADLVEAAEKSVALAKASIPDPDFVSLPSFNGDYPSVRGLVDKSIRGLSSDEAAGIVIRAVDATKEALGATKGAIEIQISTGSTSRGVTNSLGIEGQYDSTSMFLSSYPTIKTEDEQTSSFEYQISRKAAEIDPEWVGSNSAKNALANLGGSTIEDGDLPIVLSPLAVGTIFGSGFGAAINAEEVQNGRSYISDAIGEEIASSKLAIIDDALMDSGLGSRPFDAEGYPSSKKDILDQGVLRSLLHNSYTAFKDEVENTGNASRPSYSGIPMISSTNLVVIPGKGTVEDLVADIKRGVLVRNTWDRPNMTTGDLSAMVAEGYYIENGEISHPVKSTLVGINMRDVLKRVLRIGSDTRVTSSVISPSIVLESARVTSG